VVFIANSDSADICCYSSRKCNSPDIYKNTLKLQLFWLQSTISSQISIHYNLRSPPMASSHPIIVSTSLPTINLDLLQAGNETESKKLLSACRNQGFFYLDLNSDPELCKLWEGMLERMKDYFEQPLEVKMQDHRSSDNYG
jgi:hypothetical protein